jgi:hypothetical protein
MHFPKPVAFDPKLQQGSKGFDQEECAKDSSGN